MSTPISNFADAAGTVVNTFGSSPAKAYNAWPLYPELDFATNAITANTDATKASYNTKIFGGYNCIRMGLVFGFPQFINLVGSNLEV